ncbi:MAG: hypothetical protein WA930_14985 [Rhodanobacter sp.]
MKIPPLTKEQRGAILVELAASHAFYVRAGMNQAHMPPLELFARIEAELNAPSPLSLVVDVPSVFDSLSPRVSIKEGNSQRGGANENN